MISYLSKIKHLIEISNLTIIIKMSYPTHIKFTNEINYLPGTQCLVKINNTTKFKCIAII